MAKKIKLTRPELKRQRDQMTRFERYLPMLKLKQQQLQTALRELLKARRAAPREAEAAQAKFDGYRAVLADVAGVSVPALAECAEVQTRKENVAGVSIPVFEGVVFAERSYSLFATPAWVDAAVMDLREVNERQARLAILEEQYRLLQRELTKIVQRVNLFEKVKIPEAREIIRVIRIKLGDEMTAGVARAKIAKGKLESEGPQMGTEWRAEAGGEIPA